MVLILALCVSQSVLASLREKADSILSLLTLEDKVNLVVGTGRDYIYWPEAAPGMPVRNAGDTDDPRGATAFSQGRVAGAAGDSYDLSSKGLPSIVMADGPAGVRIDPKRPHDNSTYFCTAFPCATLLAASWDTDLVENIGSAIGQEANSYGVDILLAPGMNIMRSPLCGRNFEYFSEDPVLSGRMAAAYVRGVQDKGVGATLKHFVANNQETMRNGIDVVVSDRALRDIYLEGFRIAVTESQPAAVMTAYNSVNGSVMPENKHLLTDILRNEWGFEGFVLTDWWAEGNGAVQIAAGNDMLMPGTWRQYDEIMDAIKNGSLKVEQLDTCALRIIRAILRTPIGRGLTYDNRPDLNSHADLARDAATRGMVLLENRNGALPLQKNSKLALFGNGAYDTMVGGTGSGNVNRAYKIDIVTGVRNAGIDVDPTLKNFYESHISESADVSSADDIWNVAFAEEPFLSHEIIENAARNNDAALLVISRMAGESADRTLSKGDWFLNDTEQSNLENISRVFREYNKPVIVLLNMGSIIEMKSWNKIPDAVLHIWLPGQEAGNAVADVLTGKASPSGRLPMTIAEKYEDYGAATNFPHSENKATVYYTDDIFVGYRHFDNSEIEPLYPFGYGLGYTQFDYSEPIINIRDDGKAEIEIDVVNSGTYNGSDVLKVFTTYNNYLLTDKIDRSAIYIPIQSQPNNPVMPRRILKAFAKTPLLKPGETTRIHLIITL